MNENDYMGTTVSDGDSTTSDSEILDEVEELEEIEEVEQTVITYAVEEPIDYTGQLQQIIELQSKQNIMLQQNNVNQLFVIGVLSAIIVCMLLYNAIKKFI